jgi:septum formation protein
MLILASASPRRRELLAQAGYTFEVQVPSLVETPRPGEDGIGLATRLAREKAEAVFSLRRGAGPRMRPGGEPGIESGIESGIEPGIEPGRDGLLSDPLPVNSFMVDPVLVLGADTVVVCDGELLGKPADPADAARMLRLLSGRTHQVITGVAVATGFGSQTALDVAAELTHVTVQTLSEAEISAYVSSGEPMDKAGAYAIQGYAGRWIPRIRGCYFNVVGLPLALVANLLEGSRNRVIRTIPALEVRI